LGWAGFSKVARQSCFACKKSGSTTTFTEAAEKKKGIQMDAFCVLGDAV
jgi:hypothetical protein